MNEQIRSDEVQVKASSAEERVGRAVDYATKLMADIEPSYPGYNSMWMVHFYSYFLPKFKDPDPRLIETIDQFALQAWYEITDADQLSELADAV